MKSIVSPFESTKLALFDREYS